jgi:hypothetical protein
MISSMRSTSPALMGFRVREAEIGEYLLSAMPDGGVVCHCQLPFAR